MIMESVTEEKAIGCVGSGWEKIIKELYKNKPLSIKIEQVKQKFGVLRVYFSGSDEDSLKKFRDIVFSLEEQSAQTCELCGNAGGARSERPWKILCESCFNNF